MFILRLAEKGFFVFSFLLFTGAIIPVVNQVNGLQPGEPAPAARVFYYVSAVGIVFLFITSWRKVVRLILKEKLLWPFLGIALVSFLWSAAPQETFRSDVALVLSTIFGVYLAARYSLKEQLQLLAWVFGIAALLSLVFGLALPSYGVMGMSSIMTPDDLAHPEAWRGIYIHKNPLGRTMVLSALVFFLFANRSHRYRWIAWAGFVLSIGLIVLSTSSSALIILVTIMALLPIYRALRWNNALAVPFFITVIVVGGGVVTFLLANAETIVAAFGRDVTLTGRTPLWALVFYKIMQHPWLGYGYSAFWLGWNGDDSAQIWRAVGWQPPHAHNGFLDLWLDLGLLGLVAFLLNFIAVWLRAVSWIRLSKTAEGFVPLVYLTFFFLTNQTESSIINDEALWLWSLYVAVTLLMHKKSENMAESNALSPSKVQAEALKHITSDSGGRIKI